MFLILILITHFHSFVSRCLELFALEFLYSVSLVLQFLPINRKNQKWFMSSGKKRSSLLYDAKFFQAVEAGEESAIRCQSRPDQDA